MSDPTRTQRAPRYRVVVHEIRSGHQTTIMDEAAAGFIAAAASIQDGDMAIALSDGGNQELKAHVALFISGHYDA